MDVTRGTGVWMWLATALVFLPLPLSQTVPAQQVFRAGVDLVQFDVVVLDRNRRPVTGLTAADFTILEEGTPRPVVAFVAVALPSATATSEGWTRDIAPDVVRNALPDEGRLAVILLDFAIPAGQMTLAARRIAHAAVDALGPNDLAAVVRSNPITGDGLSQNFTTDRERLRAVIDSPFMGLTNPPPIGPSGGVDIVPSLDSKSPYCPCGVCQWGTIEQVAGALTDTHGRHKMVLFIGRQILVNEAPSPDPRDACDVFVSHARDRVLRALDRANVTVHSIDPSGLETLAATASGMNRAPASVNLARQANLRVLPDYTGGRAVFNTNVPEAAVADLFAESQSYYLLAFERSPGTRVNERRNVQVRVNRPGVTVRSRAGYYAPAGEANASTDADPLTQALGGLLPRTGFPVSLGLTPEFGLGGATQVNVLLGLEAGPHDDEDVTLDVAIGVFDDKARPVGDNRQTVTVPPTPAGESDLELPFTLALEPGRYEIRAAVANRSSGTAASVFGYVEVPDTADAELALSGVLLAARDGAAGVEPPASQRTVGPTLRRAFKRTEGVTAYAQVYQRSTRPSAIDVTTRIVAADNRTVSESSHTVDAADFSDSVGAVRVALPLVSLAPGRYLLTIEATKARHTARRDVPFVVE